MRLALDQGQFFFLFLTVVNFFQLSMEPYFGIFQNFLEREGGDETSVAEASPNDPDPQSGPATFRAIDPSINPFHGPPLSFIFKKDFYLG